MKCTKKEIFNIPNMLGYLRLLIIPLFIIRFVTAKNQIDYYVAAGLIMISAFSDLIDGKIARKFNMITDLGKALDPIADKLTQGAIVICLMFKVRYMWILVAIFVVKELFMGIANLVVMKKGSRLDGAQWYGKVCTFVLDTVVIYLLAFSWVNSAVNYTLMIISTALLLFSFVMYAKLFVDMLNTTMIKTSVENEVKE